MLVPEEMETFLAVVRAGSLLRGATAVHASQSTVSYRIASLERRVGRQLLLRSRGSKGVTLTSEGQRFLEIAERWEQLSSDATDLSEEGEIRLNLGTAHILARYLLSPLFERLARSGPGLSLTLRTGTGLLLEEQVLSGHLHAAFTVFRDEHIDLEVRQLLRSPMVVLVRDPAEGLVEGTRVRLRDLDQRQEIGMYWGTDHELWREHAGLGRLRIVADSVLTLPALLAPPGAWTFVPDFMSAEIAADTGCEVLVPTPSPPRQSVYLITRRSRRAVVSPELRFVERICRDIWPDWFADEDH